jgi:predicted RNA binding protein YcfA (HicA-like mRNA interferase family)
VSGGKLPILKPTELIAALERMGFRQTRQSKGG